jgi:hypothetical protein
VENALYKLKVRGSEFGGGAAGMARALKLAGPGEGDHGDGGGGGSGGGGGGGGDDDA